MSTLIHRLRPNSRSWGLQAPYESIRFHFRANSTRSLTEPTTPVSSTVPTLRSPRDSPLRNTRSPQ
ncbi:hypothetical protein AG1IA_10369 [Rhizoctonia solani AG-1 IA]|uniref:Uncharacterized protein n=1 Tax=Thanatephorus cucumeris (strain AG1-IA) TaxID=983506 RepID=L8WBP6_THACA|nr:hypothetical protein AG1IA_10369 [Rhizoctonia solani AG-1 IA]